MLGLISELAFDFVVCKLEFICVRRLVDAVTLKTRYRPLWDVTIAGPPRCRLVTVPTDPFITVTRPTSTFLSE